MAAFDDLSAAFDNLQSTLDLENQVMGNLVTDVEALMVQISALQQQVADGSGVTSQQLEDLTTRATAMVNSAQSAVTAAEAAVPDSTPGAGPTHAQAEAGNDSSPPIPETPAEQKPQEPMTVPQNEPEDPTPDSEAKSDEKQSENVEADQGTLAAQQTPPDTEAPAEEEVEQPFEPEPVAAPPRSMYTFEGGDPSLIDGSVWPHAPFRTSNGRDLYFYANDTAQGDKHGDGVGGDFSLYDGEVLSA